MGAGQTGYHLDRLQQIMGCSLSGIECGSCILQEYCFQFQEVMIPCFKPNLNHAELLALLRPNAGAVCRFEHEKVCK
jgi:hypothetical protein